MSTQSILILLALFLVPWVVIGLLLAVKCGIRRGLLASTVIVALSYVITLFGLSRVQPGEELMNEFYPCNGWQVIRRVEGTPQRFDYSETDGLFIVTDREDIRLVEGRALGLPLGDVRRMHDHVMGYQEEFPWVVIDPDSSLISPPRGHPMKVLGLPPPPGDPVAEITFLLQYPQHDDARAIVGYAAYSYGLVRCAERFVRTGRDVVVDDVLANIDYYLPVVARWFGASVGLMTLLGLVLLRHPDT